MLRPQALIVYAALLAGALCPLRTQTPDAKWMKAGREALRWTRRVVELGPRPPASEAHRKQQELIVEEMSRLGAVVRREPFTAQTPRGPIEMANLIARFNGRSDRIVVVSGHYETYHRPGLHFVGANDGGSSTGFLLALGGLLAERELADSVWLVFFDGEESIARWDRNDHTYGSRHQLAVWKRQGTLKRVPALINVDMIGDADLGLVYEQYSTPWLRDLTWRTATRLGYAKAFPRGLGQYIEDDHFPFVGAGVAAVDLIDFDYGPGNRYWHTAHDTIDKLSAKSFAVMLHVVSESVNELATLNLAAE